VTIFKFIMLNVTCFYGLTDIFNVTWLWPEGRVIITETDLNPALFTIVPYLYTNLWHPV